MLYADHELRQLIEVAKSDHRPRRAPPDDARTKAALMDDLAAVLSMFVKFGRPLETGAAVLHFCKDNENSATARHLVVAYRSALQRLNTAGAAGDHKCSATVEICLQAELHYQEIVDEEDKGALAEVLAAKS
jgi:hypothetical protein